jgi:hypothetical protein
MNDPIVEEVRRLREEHAAAYNFDVDAVYAALKLVERESGRPHVHFEPRFVTALAPQPEKPATT